MNPSNDDIGEVLTYDDGPFNPVEVDLRDISTNVVTTSIEKTISSNGRYEITPVNEEVDADAFTSVNLDVRVLPNLTTTDTTITTNSVVSIVPPVGYDGLSEVIVRIQVPQPQPIPFIQLTQFSLNNTSALHHSFSEMILSTGTESFDFPEGGNLFEIYTSGSYYIINFTNYPVGSSHSATTAGRYYYATQSSEVPPTSYVYLYNLDEPVVRLYDSIATDTNRVSTRFSMNFFQIVGLPQ